MADEKSEKVRADEKKLKEKRKLLNRQIETLGRYDEKTLATRNDIASLNLQLCQYDEALAQYKEVCTRRSEILGLYHPDTIAAQSKIAQIYNKMDRPDEAIVVFKKIYEKKCFILGPYREDTQGTLRIIGHLLEKLKEYDEAFEIYDRLIQGLESQHNIAQALRRENPDKAAEFFYKIYEKVLNEMGPNSEKTWEAKFHLGKALTETKKTEEALNICKEVLKQKIKSEGPFHEHSISNLRRVGTEFFKLGILDEGFNYLYKALNRTKLKFGPDDEKTFKIQTKIADLLCSEGKYNEALQVYNDMYNIQMSKCPSSREAFETKLIIGDTYSEKGDYRKAYEAFSEVEKAFNMDYNENANLKSKMLALLLKQRKYDEALRIRKYMHEETKKAFGLSDPKTFDAYEDIAEVFVHMKRYDRALEIFNDVLASRKRYSDGNDLSDTLRTHQYMAELYAKQHNYTEAMSAYKEVYKVRKDLPFTDHTYYSLTNLAGMLCLLGKHEESLHAYEEQCTMPKLEDETNTTNLEKNIVYTLVKEDVKNDNILNAFRDLSDVASKLQGTLHTLATLTIKGIIAEILQAQKKYCEAVEAFETIYESLKNLPPSRPDVIMVRNNIAEMYRLSGRFEKAFEIFHKMYEDVKSTVGSDDPKCLVTHLALARAMYFVLKTDASVSHYLNVYRKSKRKLGPDQPYILQHGEDIKSLRFDARKSLPVEIKDNFGSSPVCVDHNGTRLDNNQDAFGATPLHYAAEGGDIKLVRRLLQSGAFYDVKDKLGEKPLYYASSDEIAALLYQVGTYFVAVEEGDEETVTTLLEDEIILGARDKEGNTGLHRACKGGHVYIVKILVENGIDRLLRNKKGELALDIAMAEGNSEIIDILQDLDKIDRHCLNDVMTECGGNTALHLAARKGHLETLQELLGHNADPTIINNHGYTPLHIATSEGNTKIVKTLLKCVNEAHKKKLNDFVNCTSTADGTSALHIASTKGFTEIADLLLNHGANVHSKAT